MIFNPLIGHGGLIEGTLKHDDSGDGIIEDSQSAINMRIAMMDTIRYLNSSQEQIAERNWKGSNNTLIRFNKETLAKEAANPESGAIENVT